MRRLKVGDDVVLVEAGWGYGENLVGKIGTIVFCNGDSKCGGSWDIRLRNGIEKKNVWGIALRRCNRVKKERPY